MFSLLFVVFLYFLPAILGRDKSDATRYFPVEFFSGLDADRVGRGVHLGHLFGPATLCALCSRQRGTLLFAVRHAGSRWRAFLRSLRPNRLDFLSVWRSDFCAVAYFPNL